MRFIADEIKVRREWIARNGGFNNACMHVGSITRNGVGNCFGNIPGAIIVVEEGPCCPVAGRRRRICRRRRPFKSDVGNSVDFAPKHGVGFSRVATHKVLIQRAVECRLNCRCRLRLSRVPGCGREPGTTISRCCKGVDRVILQIGVDLWVSRLAIGDAAYVLVANKTQVCPIQHNRVRIGIEDVIAIRQGAVRLVGWKIAAWKITSNLLCPR